jgi:hypothetical protein
MHVRLVALILLVVAGCSEDPVEGPAELVASIVEEYDLGFFGGLSGIDLSADGEGVTLLLDGGLLIEGRIGRDEAGRPLGLRRWKLIPIETPADTDFGGRGIDTEGLAVAGTDVFVSLERIHAVWRIGPFGEVVERLPRHPDFDRLHGNGSLEALAVDAGGALYTLPERSDGGSFPVWRYAGGEWSRAFEIPRRGWFRAVGADFGPDGRFYLLERRMIVPYRFATRIRRFELGDGGIVGEETLLETPTGTHGNLEGLAVWRDGDGATRLTMVSDDNFSRLQETEIVEYRLPPELDATAAAR